VRESSRVSMVRRALVAGVTLALAGASGIAAAPSAGADVDVVGSRTTYTCTDFSGYVGGEKYDYVVPSAPGVYDITVTVAGTAGTGGRGDSGIDGGRGGYGGVVVSRISVPAGTRFGVTLACTGTDGRRSGVHVGGSGNGSTGLGGSSSAVYDTTDGFLGCTDYPDGLRCFANRVATPLIEAGGGGGGGGAGIFGAGGRGGGGGRPAEDGVDGSGIEGGDGGDGGAGGTLDGESTSDAGTGRGGGGGGGCVNGEGGRAGNNGSAGGGGGGGLSCTSSGRTALTGTTFVADANASNDGYVRFEVTRIGIPVSQQPPIFFVGPDDATVVEGETASFTQPSELGAASLQWQRSDDGARTFFDIDDETDSTYSFTPTLADSGAVFRIIGTNSGGSSPGPFAALRVLPVGEAAPTVTHDPADATVDGFGYGFFYANGTGTPAPTLQWERADAGSSTFSPIPGATDDTLFFPVQPTDDGARYRATLSSASGTATTATATLSYPAAPAVEQQPSDQTALAGETATFTAAATGAPLPTVQWESSPDGTTFSAIDGATSTTYERVVVAADDGLQVRAVFSNASGTATTASATLLVAEPVAPAITAEPGDQDVAEGSLASFTAAASGSPAPSVQWQRTTDGTTFADVAGATSATFTFEVTAADSGTGYRAVFTNAAGTATTGVADLVVRTSPAITTGPADQTVVRPGTATFEVEASGDPAPTYQWQRAEPGGGVFSDLATATAPSYSFTPEVADSGARFRVVIANGVGSITSDPATLTVQDPPVITSATTGTLAVGTAGSIGFAATGTPSPELTLTGTLPGGLSFVDGGDGTATLSGTPAGGTAGTYDLVLRATNPAGEVQQAFRLTVERASVVVGTVTSSADPAILGQPVTVAVVVSSTGGTPTGSVQFRTDDVVLGTAAVGADGRASLVVSDLAVGSHAVRAVYSGDADFAPGGSVAPLVQDVTYGIRYLHDTERAHRRGSIIVLRVALLDHVGRIVSSPDVALTSMAGAFRFVPSADGGSYQLLLDTTGRPAGRQSLPFMATGDPLIHLAPFVLR
jgi:hypothetical protein